MVVVRMNVGKSQIGDKTQGKKWGFACPSLVLKNLHSEFLLVETLVGFISILIEKMP